MSSKIHLNIGGMVCEGCPERIEEALNSTDGVIKASASFPKGTVDVCFDEGKISEKKIAKIINSLGYKVLKDGAQESFNPLKAAGFLVVIIALFFIMRSLGILNRLAPMSLAEAGMGYGMLFVTGLVTSVHCIAMCGGIGLSQSLPGRNDSPDGKAVSLQTIIPDLSYNLGRVVSYTLIGLILGSIGMVIGGAGVGISYKAQGIIKIIAGVFMLIMGINMLGIFPWLRRFSIRLPKAFARLIGQKKKNVRVPFIVGLLNGLMPCGPLQSMWIVAFATFSPLAGALSMFFFSLGTVPLMLGLGSLVSMLGKRFKEQVTVVGSILVAVLGLAMLSQGTVLAGSDYKENTIESSVAAGVEARIEAAPSEEVQVINSTLSLRSYPDITVQKGVPVRWIIDAPEGSISGCNYMMVIPAYGIEHAFEVGENVIEFVPEETGTISYSCWMGMIYGTINVVD